MAMMVLVREQKLRPHLLVHPNVMEDFAEADTADPNCVVIGDCAEHFTFEKLNDAFQVGAENIFCNFKNVFIHSGSVEVQYNSAIHTGQRKVLQRR